jgi:transposase-like protein
MEPISYARHQFPPEIIRRAVWLHLRFTLSYRDVEELPAERGLDVSYETTRRWTDKFGSAYARNCVGCDRALWTPGTWTRRSSQRGAGGSI